MYLIRDCFVIYYGAILAMKPKVIINYIAWGDNERGVSFVFGNEVLSNFL
jgi:hypothetical protein